MIDWKKAYKDYLAGMTHAQIAVKYGCSRQAVSRHSSEGGWLQKKRDARDRAAKRLQVDDAALQKVADAAAGRLGSDRTELIRIAEKALKTCDALLDGALPSTIRGITGALKDVKEILGIKSELDLEEQKARIDNLRKQYEASVHGDGIKVVLSPDVIDYAD